MAVVNFLTADRQIEIPEGVDDVNLLRLAIRHEVGVPWRCAGGNCGTDRVVVVDGAEHLSPPRRRERERLGDLLDQGIRLLCQTYASGSVTVVWDPDQQGIDEDSAAGRRLVARWLADDDER